MVRIETSSFVCGLSEPLAETQECEAAGADPFALEHLSCLEHSHMQYVRRQATPASLCCLGVELSRAVIMLEYRAIAPAEVCSAAYQGIVPCIPWLLS